ncbi:Ribosome-recycling factor [Quillaja saponaria]|uniref:Ribosome-recycling factor, chloroplastic n=1 Tax=Quillaja saponaria TaxID=32244 RepID=A0AAD7Q4K9_QUISA|nr:Ribosome-recycling factor [Quillaja saponaria]
MSACLRRAFCYRNSLLLRGSAFHGRDLSRIIESPINICSSDANRLFTLLPAANFLIENRRTFAKGRKSSIGGMREGKLQVHRMKQLVSTLEVSPDVGPTIKASAVSQMEAAIAALSGELQKLRTGRASPGMLDHIIVETSGVKMPLNRIAVVSVLDPKTLSINPYNPDLFYADFKNLEKAIVSSPLGLNPKVDGDRLIAVIPPLTKEHIQAMSKLAAKSCEDARQSIRRSRQKAMDSIKKLHSSLPKDDIKRLEKDVDELTKKFVKSAEDMSKAKEKEITQG